MGGEGILGRTAGRIGREVLSLFGRFMVIAARKLSRFIKMGKLGDEHKVAQRAITDQIQESVGKFGTFCSKKQEVIHRLTGGDIK